MLSPQAAAALRRLMSDFPLFCRECLCIRTKDGKIQSFELNRAQRHIHARLEKQLADTGRVRAVILKGRQQGCSTYVGARFYRKTSWAKGMRTFILAHRDDATDNLFRMTRRFQDNMPDGLRPSTSYSSRKELVFNLMESSYGLGTAKSGGVGRSDTIQHFHGSEVGFWDHADEIVSGVLQAVSNSLGTEVVLESTANGMGNFFHQVWQAAESGKSDYAAIFIPWFWQPEYSLDVPPGFSLDGEEEELARLYGLTPGQLAWRRVKIAELRDPLLFRQEYPCTPAEAFQVTGHDSFIKPELIMRARKSVADGVGPVVCGVDPARFGDDSTTLVLRQGRKILDAQRHYKKDTMQVSGLCKMLLDKEHPHVERMFVDVGGLGAGVVDRLGEMGYGDRVVGVNFGSAPMDEKRYKNKRAEMWGLLLEWLSSPAPPEIPDDDSLHADLAGPSYSYDSSSRIILESKESMRKRGVASPDMGDALALTFAFPVRPTHPRQQFADYKFSFTTDASFSSASQQYAD